MKYATQMMNNDGVSPIFAPDIVPMIRKTMKVIVVNAPTAELPIFEVDISRPIRVFFPIT